MADSASNGYLSVAEAIDDLRTRGVSVDFTDQPVDFIKTREDGHVLAAVGLMTVTRTGRVFVELFDSTDHLRLTMLATVERDAEQAVAENHKVTSLDCWLHPDTVLELRTWAELRDSLLVGA
jgi:hypothetical protein